MKFVPAEKLKAGMRLARPIFNKTGVLLYDRNTKLTRQGISSIRNFNLIGVYILEPAEPLPPLTEEDRAFERFQTMGVFALRDVLSELRQYGNEGPLVKLTDEIIRHYGLKPGKITFTQNLRSAEDNVYKHSLNTAILSAAIFSKLSNDPNSARRVVMSALLHDMGLLDVPLPILRKTTAELTEEDYEVIDKCRVNGHNLILEKCHLDSTVLKNIALLIRDIKERRDDFHTVSIVPDMQLETLKTAYLFDTLTAMKMGEEPKSDIEAYRFLHHPKNHVNAQTVKALTQAIKIVPVGCCVRFTNGDKGIVLTENENDILRPFVLSFRDNKIYNLSDGHVFEKIQIEDVLKTMDNRHVMTDQYEKYREALKTGKAKTVSLES